MEPVGFYGGRPGRARTRPTPDGMGAPSSRAENGRRGARRYVRRDGE